MSDSFKELIENFGTKEVKVDPRKKLIKEIVFFEEQLRELLFEGPFMLSFDQLDVSNSDKPIGPHGYTYKTYALEWKNNHLFVRNLLAQKSVLLESCPSHLLTIAIELFESFDHQLTNFLGSQKETKE